MKKIEVIKEPINNILTGLEYNDLCEDVQEVVLSEQIDFEIEAMTENSPYFYLCEEMEKMQTPWFLGAAIFEKHESDIIESIKLNNYLFDESGDILPITYHCKENKIVKTTYREFDCIII